jgi:TraY domain
MAKDAVNVSAQVPNATRAELERRAEAGYRSLSAEIRLALDAHLRKWKEQNA